MFPDFLEMTHVHSLLGLNSFPDSQTIDAVIKKYCIIISCSLPLGSMNITFLDSKCTSASLLLHSRLVTRIYFWKWRWFVGLKTSEIEGLWSSHSEWLLKLWAVERKDHLAVNVEEIRVWSSVSQPNLSHWICSILVAYIGFETQHFSLVSDWLPLACQSSWVLLLWTPF